MIDPIVNRRLSRRRRWKHAIWFIARLVVVPLLRVGMRLRVYGTQHVPGRGGAVLIANHINWFDPVLIEAAAPRPVMWMAKKEVFDYPVLRWFATQAGAFPVDRGKPDRTALRQAAALLDEGLIVGLFPEGTRTRTSGLKEPYGGASMIAVRAGAPVIPCALVGSDALPLTHFKERGLSRWPKLRLIIGEPFTLATHRDDGGRWKLEELTDAMMIEIARLLPPDYRGMYADRADAPHPAVRRDDVRFTGVGEGRRQCRGIKLIQFVACSRCFRAVYGRSNVAALP